MARGMKSSFGIHFMEDRILSLVATIIARVVIVEAHYTKFVQIGSAMTTSTNICKSYL
jgi:hypothetical protein